MTSKLCIRKSNNGEKCIKYPSESLGDNAKLRDDNIKLRARLEKAKAKVEALEKRVPDLGQILLVQVSISTSSLFPISTARIDTS
jgi:hypothetical protein